MPDHSFYNNYISNAEEISPQNRKMSHLPLQNPQSSRAQQLRPYVLLQMFENVVKGTISVYLDLKQMSGLQGAVQQNTQE